MFCLTNNTILDARCRKISVNLLVQKLHRKILMKLTPPILFLSSESFRWETFILECLKDIFLFLRISVRTATVCRQQIDLIIRNRKHSVHQQKIHSLNICFLLIRIEFFNKRNSYWPSSVCRCKALTNNFRTQVRNLGFVERVLGVREVNTSQLLYPFKLLLQVFRGP